MWSIHPDTGFAYPSLQMGVLNVIAFVPNPWIGMADSFGPGPACEMAEETALEYLLAGFGGHSRSYAAVVVTVIASRLQKHHAKRTRHCYFVQKKLAKGLLGGWW
jgi:hypothetical protein